MASGILWIKGMPVKSQTETDDREKRGKGEQEMQVTAHTRSESGNICKLCGSQDI
jgi:hypothetical protein